MHGAAQIGKVFELTEIKRTLAVNSVTHACLLCSMSTCRH